MVEYQLPKLTTRVRFPSSAPKRTGTPFGCLFFLEQSGRNRRAKRGAGSHGMRRRRWLADRRQALPYCPRQIPVSVFYLTGTPFGCLFFLEQSGRNRRAKCGAGSHGTRRRRWLADRRQAMPYCPRQIPVPVFYLTGTPFGCPFYLGDIKQHRRRGGAVYI